MATSGTNGNDGENAGGAGLAVLSFFMRNEITFPTAGTHMTIKSVPTSYAVDCGSEKVRRRAPATAATRSATTMKTRRAEMPGEFLRAICWGFTFGDWKLAPL